MTKYIFISLLVFSSCASLDYKEIYNLSKNSLFGVDDIEINQDLINEIQYSFIKVRIGKSRIAIMPLAEINENIYKWVGSDSIIYTLDGKIVKTIGLDHNIDLVNKTQKQAIIFLRNPDAMITQKISYEIKDLDIVNSNSQYDLINEEFHTVDFKWSGKNTYIRDKKSGLYFKSTQEIHPRLEKISLDFVYTY